MSVLINHLGSWQGLIHSSLVEFSKSLWLWELGQERAELMCDCCCCLAPKSPSKG